MQTSFKMSDTSYNCFSTGRRRHEAGLVNGIRGEVVDIAYAPDEPALAPALHVVVRPHGNTGLTLSLPGHNEEGNTMCRMQLPPIGSVGL